MRSRELSSITVLIAGVIFLFLLSSQLYELWQNCFVQSLNLNFEAKYASGATDLNPQSTYHLILNVLNEMGSFLVPFFIFLSLIAIAANLFQGGFLLTLFPIAPKLSRLDPIKGFSRIFFSPRSLMEIFKGFLKLIIIGTICYITIKNEYQSLPLLQYQSAGQILLYIGKVSFKIFIRAALLLIIMAVLDYIFQKWEYEQNLKMTKEEIRQEYKELEGDPKIKARIRSIQRQIARRRMMAAVPEAEVVITNPVRIAVALKYEMDAMEAPVVIAKGERLIAQKIKEVALENDIPIVQDPPLARLLFENVEIGQAISIDLYQAVAEVLAYIWSLKGKSVTNKSATVSA